MKKYLTLTIMAVLILAASPAAQAATHYIRSGATGAGTGADWVNAWPTFAAVTWARGDTYYVAGGTYNENVMITKALSGTSWIKVKKANTTDNAGDSGWDVSYATNQAVINGALGLYDGYIEIDGVTGSLTSGHGIKVNQQSTAGNGVNIQNQNCPFNIFHLDIVGPGYSSSATPHDGIYAAFATRQKGLHIAYCWIHEFTRNGITLNRLIGTSYDDYGLLFENNVLSETGGVTDMNAHGQGMQIGYNSEDAFTVIRGNYFRNVSGSGNIAMLGGASALHHDARIYNNVFYSTNNSVYQSGPGVICSFSGAGTSNISIYNNSFYGVNLGQCRFLDNVVTNNVLINNVWENSHFTGGHIGFATNSNNCYFGNTGAGVPSGTPNQINGSSTTFVNAGAVDFRLLAGGYAVDNGTDLSAYFTTDKDEVARPQGAAWDIGAYEYLPAHYIRDDALAGGDGSDWDRAWQQLPATLVRGDTYYLAKGSYPSYTFDDPESGGQYITIKKATLADHGTDTGWSSVYGSGQAVFYSPENLYSQITFKTGYYIFDGNGTHMIPSKNPEDYGFKIYSDSTGNWAGIIQIGVNGLPAPSNIIIKYTHIYNTTNASNSVSNGTVSVRFGSRENVKLQNCYFQNSGRDGLQISSSSRILVERCYIERLGKRLPGIPDNHGQTVQIFYGGSDIIFRWNIWEANEGEGLIAIAAKTVPSVRIRFYGNVVFVGYGQTTATAGFGGTGIVGVMDQNVPISNMYVYNNSIINIGGVYGGYAGFRIVASGSDLYNYNNLFYNSKDIYYGGWTAYDYQASGESLYLPGMSNGSNGQTGLTSGIFQDYTNNDFRLVTHTDTGLVLTSQVWWNDRQDDFFGYLDSNLDMYGNIRGAADGIWDRGAYQYSGGFSAGDVSGDGIISAYDAALALQNDPRATVDKADVNGDGVVDALDAALIAQQAVGLIAKFPVES